MILENCEGVVIYGSLKLMLGCFFGVLKAFFKEIEISNFGRF